MISSLGSQWTTADLTGNGQFVDTGAAIYVVSNSAPTIHILKSTDDGRVFTSVAEFELTEGSFQFDPSISYDGTHIHIIGSEQNQTDPLRFDLVYRSLEIATDTISPSVRLVEGSRVHSGYDIESMPNGKHVVVVSVSESFVPLVNGYSLLSFVIEASVPSLLVIQEEGYNRNGEVFGGISLASDANVAELYYTAHNKRVTFGSIGQQIRTRTLDTDSPTSWSAATNLHDFTSHYIDDKLTVLEVGTSRVIANVHYVQNGSKFSTTLLLGRRLAGNWMWSHRPSLSPSWAITEPTLVSDESGNVRLAYLAGNVNTNVDGTLGVIDLDLQTLGTTLRQGAFSQLQFKWLRGSAYPIKDTAKWALIGERKNQSGITPVYVSELNTPPVVVLSPLSSALQREQLLTLDATATQDNDYDSLEFSWSVDTPSVELRPIPNSPGKINVWAPKSMGPTEQTVVVTVTVQDLDYTGQPINPPQSLNSTLTIPANSAPTITWGDGSDITVPRNSAVVVFPTVEDVEGDPIVYSWRQLSGPSVTLLDATPNGDPGVLSTSPYLIVLTHGVDVLGESVSFELTVSDEINTPVVSNVSLTIEPIDLTNLDQRFISRSVYQTIGSASAIVNRNNHDSASSWNELQIGGVSSDFFRVRHAKNIEHGEDRDLYISNRSVVVLAKNNSEEILFRKVFLPGNRSGDIIDAFLTQKDEIIILDDQGRVLRYGATEWGVNNMTDHRDYLVDLTSYLRNSTVKFFECSPVRDDKRVMAFVTNKGLLLAQFRDSDFVLEAVLFLSVFDLNLYGGDDVIFVRFRNVENLRRGRVLIGSVSPVDSTFSASRYEYFETIYDLSIRAVVNIWDRTSRINEMVETGELLDIQSADYHGRLQAPELDIKGVDSTSFNLLWEQIRPDLVTNYNIYAEIVPGVPGTSIIQKHEPSVVQIDLPPMIVAQPQALNVEHTVSAAFVVVAAGAEPITYQWFKDGVSIPSSNSAHLYPPSGDAGSNFHVIVTDSEARSITSQIVPYVIKPWITTQPESQTILLGDPVTFSVVASGTGPLYYQWFKAGQPVDLATTSSLTLPITTIDDNETSYSVRISDSYGNQLFSTSAVLTVTP